LTDPFLEAHRLARLCYAASGPAPLSIRDQYHRGVTLVERLFERGEISPDKALLVIGAGVAGVAAAIAAARQQVPTILCDTQLEPFALQRDATTRFIDACVYDWPVDHWRSGAMPPIKDPVLNLSAAKASVLAARWDRQLEAAEDAYARKLKILGGFNANLDDIMLEPASDEPWINVTLTECPPEHADASAPWVPRTLSRSFAAVIWAASNKWELTSLESNDDPPIKRFESGWFWSSDGVAALRSADSVLISGGGDGALQDYLRAVTGIDDLGIIVDALPIPDAMMHALSSAEDRTHRGRVWFPDLTQQGRSTQRALLRKHEERWLEPIDQTYRAAAEELLSDPAVLRSLEALLRTRKQGNPRVHLVHRTPYLTPYYGLNRFLTHLFAAYLRTQRDYGESLFSGVEIVTVTDDEDPPGPPLWATKQEPGGYKDRFRKAHTVTFTGDGTGHSAYNVILIRHGFRPGLPGSVEDRLRIRKQLLPFFCP
jgi:hypothetical protein